MRTMNVYKSLNAVFLAFLHYYIEDLHGVLRRFAVSFGKIRIYRICGIGIHLNTGNFVGSAVHP